jgi:pimeloyl-ACP methyl ester carboxylesterase
MQRRIAVTQTAPTRLFIHGLEGSSQGTKSRYLRQLFPDIMTPDFGGPLEDRMTQLEALLASKSNLILIGSSLGGLMAAIYTCRYAERMQQLILLAPALANDAFIPFHDCRVDVPTRVYHGTEDDVVPIGPVRAVAQKVFTRLTFEEVVDDHFLSKTLAVIPWLQLI